MTLKLIHFVLYASIMVGIKVFKLQPLRILNSDQLLNKFCYGCWFLPDFKLRVADLSWY